jgi:hypothetical protein
MSGTKEKHEESLFASTDRYCTGTTDGEQFKSGIIEVFAIQLKFHRPEGTRMMIFFESGCIQT